MTQDPRFSRLMKMQESYVTEEAIRATEEQAKPKEPDPPAEPDDEYYDEEEFLDDEEYIDDEEYDDFEDDEYEEPAQAEVLPVAPPPELEAADDDEPVDDGDHRVAQLRKLRQQFVADKDMEVKAGPAPEVFREIEVAKVVCPNCQSEEARTDKICSKCGAKLPNITAIEEERYNPGTMNVAVMKYVNAVKKLKEGAWDIDEFEDFLHEREQLSQAHIDGLIELIEESGAAEWLPDATKFLLDSTGMLEDAIANMIMKVEQVRDQQPTLEAEYAAQLAEFESLLDAGKVKRADAPVPPSSIEERITLVNFNPELDDINRSNDLLLNTLRLIDKFQKESDDEIEVSL